MSKGSEYTQLGTSNRLEIGLDDIESRTERPARRVRFRSILTVYISSLFMQMEYAILMPTVWSYIQSVGGSKFLLGVAISSFSVARMILFIFIGAWLDKRGFKEPYAFSFTCGIIGSFLYGFAGRANSVWFIVAGRILVGIGAASSTLNESYITTVFSSKERTKQLAIFDGTQVVGMALGPALNVFFTKVSFSWWIIDFNELTAAGYIMVVLNVLNLLGLFFFIEEPKDEEGYAPLLREEPEDQHFLDKLRLVLVDRGGYLVWCVKFTIGFIVTSLDTAITPITMTQFGWDEFTNSLVFAALAGVSIIGVVVTIILSKICGSQKLLLIGCVMTAVAFISLDVFCFGRIIPKLPFLIAGCFLIAALPILNAASSSLYARMIEPNEPGKFFGIAQLCLVFGKVLGPLLAGYTLHAFLSHYQLFLTITVVFLGFSVFPLAISWDKVRPFNSAVQ